MLTFYFSSAYLPCAVKKMEEAENAIFFWFPNDNSLVIIITVYCTELHLSCKNLTLRSGKEEAFLRAES